MKISTDALLKAMNILSQHLAESGVKEVDLPQVAYWAIPKKYEYDAYTEPAEHTLGSLEDDWSELSKVVENPERAVGYGFVWLGAILRAVGQSVSC